ncbi:endothelin-converting enzyme homolog [Porites lutea]|uniref:endothelin-converting enzyme homolog n=1 Tax=Porites lutea TaxID=51062 RepID=UPI003CC671B9
MSFVEIITNEESRMTWLTEMDSFDGTTEINKKKNRGLLIERKSKLCSNVKCLMLLIVLLVICCLILLNLYLIERAKKTEVETPEELVNSSLGIPKQQRQYGGSCWSTDCLHATSDLLNSIDPSAADPCQDFYQYACGGWMKKNPLPPGVSRWDQFIKLTAENNKLIEMLLENKELKAVYSREEAVWKALTYYDSCMDKDEVERLKAKPLERLIQEYGSWSITDKRWREENWNLISNLAKVHKYLALPVFFETTVAIDNRNSSQYAITMRESRTSLSQREHLTDDKQSLRFREAYMNLMKNLTRKLGSINGSEDDLLKMFEFEKELAKITTPPFRRLTFEQAYKKLTVFKIQTYTGEFFNWTEYLRVMMEENSYKVDDQSEVVVYSLGYLKKLMKLLRRTPKRTVANYLMWRVVKQKFLHLSSDFTELLKFYYHEAFNYWRASDQHQLCLLGTSLKFGIPLSKVFLDLKFFGTSRKMAIDIIGNIRAAFIDTLEKQDWMDNKTKEAAKQKAESIIENIGYPDYIMDEKYLADQYKDVEIDPRTFFDNDVSTIKNRNLRTLAKAGTKVDKSEWPFPPTMLNAFYSYNQNKMVFPAAILQPPFYNVRYPSVINYGAIGGIMAHEITHGFDNKGKLYDVNGNRRKWWRNATLVNFQQKSRCLEEQYSNFTFYGHKVNGETTLSENIADNGGVTVAFEAYRKWVREHWEEPRLPGVMLTNDQVFFISYARNWCSHYSKIAAGIATKYFDHSPMPWRVNGTLRNIPEFSKAFNCPLGSPMNPIKKCKVW